MRRATRSDFAPLPGSARGIPTPAAKTRPIAAQRSARIRILLSVKDIGRTVALLSQKRGTESSDRHKNTDLLRANG
jgi:hypothetical protein